MIASGKNTFSSSAFRAVSDNAQGLEFIAIGFGNVAVINEDDGLVRNVFTDGGEVRFQSNRENSPVKMSGKAFHGFDFWESLRNWSTISVRREL